MSPLDPDHFADVDGNAIEDARLSRCRAYSGAAEPINWSLSDGARRTIRTPPATSDVFKCGPSGPGAPLSSRRRRAERAAGIGRYRMSSDAIPVSQPVVKPMAGRRRGVR